MAEDPRRVPSAATSPISGQIQRHGPKGGTGPGSAFVCDYTPLSVPQFPRLLSFVPAKVSARILPVTTKLPLPAQMELPTQWESATYWLPGRLQNGTKNQPSKAGILSVLAKPQPPPSWGLKRTPSRPAKQLHPHHPLPQSPQESQEPSGMLPLCLAYHQGSLPHAGPRAGRGEQ